MNLKDKKPGTIHANENSVNLGYSNLKEMPNGSFRPVKSVPYLWVYHRGSSDLIVGVEEPWKHPLAFNVDTNSAFWKDYAEYAQEKVKSRRKGRLGHPTLSTAFHANGRVNVQEGTATIGGELKYQSAKDATVWTIDNNSGRFGRFASTNATDDFKKTRAADINITLREVAKIFRDKLGERVLFKKV